MEKHYCWWLMYDRNQYLAHFYLVYIYIYILYNYIYILYNYIYIYIYIYILYTNFHFPKEHKFHKIFNRNTLKLSYSCMSKIKTKTHIIE